MVSSMFVSVFCPELSINLISANVKYIIHMIGSDSKAFKAGNLVGIFRNLVFQTFLVIEQLVPKLNLCFNIL